MRKMLEHLNRKKKTGGVWRKSDLKIRTSNTGSCKELLSV